jgi:hypothetical protein
MTAPVSVGQTANWAVGHEIYELFIADAKINSSVWTSVDNGVVTLGGTLPSGVERRRITDRIRELAGVNQVKDGPNDATPALALSARDQQ